MELKKPDRYILCQNDNCKNAPRCLRNMCYKQIPSDKRAIIVFNPAFYPTGNDTCTEFRTSEKIKIAWGIRNFFGSLPHAKAIAIKSALIYHFGKTKYYRFFREELPIMPKDQRTIKTIFLQNGVETEPNFSRFTEDFNW